MLLTLIAAVVLAALVLPWQEAILKEAILVEAILVEAILVEAILVEAETPPTPAESGATTPSLETPQRRRTVQLAMFTGIFNLLWATVTVLMIVRPGSTTGA